MTVQILDSLIYNRRTFSIIGLKRKGLYSPNDFGLKPIALHSANWRGYVMQYKIYYKKLALDNMQVSIEEIKENIPKINNVIPVIENVGPIYLFYQNLRLKTYYTGKILIAKEYIYGLHDSMGPPDPISFKTLIELDIKNGDFLLAEDLSDKIAEYREQTDANGTQRPPSDLLYRISNTYSLDYVFK